MKAAGDRATAFSKKPSKTIWAALIFGADDGVVSDTARTLLKSWKVAPEDVQTLDEDTVRKDPSSFLDALEARALLGGERAVKVRTRGDKIGEILLNAMKLGESDPARYAAKLIIEADALAKKSKLRKGYEEAENAAALQLFEDASQDVSALVRDELAREDIAIDPDALAMIASGLPGHRSLARAEIEKFALYAHDLNRPLAVSDIRALSATDVDHAVSALVTLTLDGRLPEALTELDRLNISGASEITILRAFQRDLRRMQDAQRLLLTPGGGDVGMKLRPPVWKSDWPAFRKRLDTWSLKRLNAALARIYDAEAEVKSAGPVAGPVLRQLIRAFALAAG